MAVSAPRPTSEIAEIKQKLRGLNSRYQNTLSNISVAQQTAENTTLSTQERNKAKARYSQEQSKLELLKTELGSLRTRLSRLNKQEYTDELRTEVRQLEEEYNAKLDKRSPETISLKQELDEKRERLKTFSEVREAPAGFEASGTEFLTQRGAKTPAAAKKKVADITLESDTTPGTRSGAGNVGVTPDAQKDKEKKKTREELYQEALATAQDKYSMPEIIFTNVPSLGDLLEKFVTGKIKTAERFAAEIRNDIWWRQNSEVIRNRYLQSFNYEDLKNKGQLTGSTAFENDIRTISEKIQKRAQDLFGSKIQDEEAVEKIAKDLYIYNLENSENEINQRIAKFIRPTFAKVGDITTEGFGGQAKANYDALYGVARANGFKLEDIVPRIPGQPKATTTSILQDIATGKLDVNRIQDDIRRMASAGQSDYVKDLLAQGYNLDQIYAPYRTRMAQILEIEDPMSIDITDPALRMGIPKDGDINMFDYEKALRKDSRWQYTQNAREEVDKVLDTVLRDFGFRR